MESVMWTVKDAAAAWGISVSRARKLMERVPGVQRQVQDGIMIWLIPAGSQKPEGRKAGRKPKTQ